MPEKRKYKRVLLKLSGEALQGEKGYGIDWPALSRLTAELESARKIGTEMAVVIGGGNIFRGLEGAEEGFDRATGDHMGMLATVINGIALNEALRVKGIDAPIFSAFVAPGIVPQFNRTKAMSELRRTGMIIVAGGTGRPYFTTDTTAALRALELNCEIILKASHIDGVYDSDPAKNPSAKRYDKLDFAEAVEKRLKVMDLTAFSLCMENDLPVIVFDMMVDGNLSKVLIGDEMIGTLVS